MDLEQALKLELVLRRMHFQPRVCGCNLGRGNLDRMMTMWLILTIISIRSSVHVRGLEHAYRPNPLVANAAELDLPACRP